MLIVSHPTGNTFVRALLDALDEAGSLCAFFTTLAVHQDDWPLKLLPPRARRQALRRSYNVSQQVLSRHPTREMARLFAASVGWKKLLQHERGWASVDAVYRDLDARVAARLEALQKRGAQGVYAYEDGALASFRRAEKLGLKKIYELPIAYWEANARLFREEAERWPEWEPTLVGTRDSQDKFARKTEELERADAVIVPSNFVLHSMPQSVRDSKACHVVPFGSPAPKGDPEAARVEAERADAERERTAKSRPLRVLFAGSMSQRKGLADLFAAMKLLKRSDVELVILGSPQRPLSFYREKCDFSYESPRPHSDVLALMRSCDILALPSIAEGRALVQQEAMTCGLPLLVTANAGGDDLIDEGETGFLVPIRAPERIAERIDWFAEHRDALPAMRVAARRKAADYTWPAYGREIVRAAQNALST